MESKSNFKWPVGQTRQGHEPLIDFILLAEFDIDSGSTIRHHYPTRIPNCMDDWLAENMLPEDIWIFPNSNEFQIDPSKRLLYGLNLVRTKYDASVRRGAVVKAMAVFSRYHFIEICKSPLILALDEYFDNPSVEVLEALYKSLSLLDLSLIPRPNPIERSLMRRGLCLNQMGKVVQSYIPHNWLNKSNINLTFGRQEEIPVNIPLFRSPDEVGDINLSLVLRTFGTASMRIFHALITKQRILFVGHNQGAGDMAQIVLSTVAMVSPPIAGVVRRAFPYCSLSDLSFLETPGYIAAVTNPMFAQRDAWWDLICKVDSIGSSGTVKSAEEVRAEEAVLKGKNMFSRAPTETSPHEALDAKFIVVALSGIDMRLGDDWVQGHFHDYTSALLAQAMDSVVNPPLTYDTLALSESTRKVLSVNANRASILAKTCEVSSMPLHPWVWALTTHNQSSTLVDSMAATWDKNEDGEVNIQKSVTFPGEVLRSHVRKLQLGVSLSAQEVLAIYEDMDRYLTSEASCQALLHAMPDCTGALSSIALGLLRPELIIRSYTTKLLQRFERFLTIQPAMKGLNSYLKKAYQRQLASSTPTGSPVAGTSVSTSVNVIGSSGAPGDSASVVAVSKGAAINDSLDPKTKSEQVTPVSEEEVLVSEVLSEEEVQVQVQGSVGQVTGAPRDVGPIETSREVEAAMMTGDEPIPIPIPIQALNDVLVSVPVSALAPSATPEPAPEPDDEFLVPSRTVDVAEGESGVHLGIGDDANGAKAVLESVSELACTPPAAHPPLPTYTAALPTVPTENVDLLPLLDTPQVDTLVVEQQSVVSTTEVRIDQAQAQVGLVSDVTLGGAGADALLAELSMDDATLHEMLSAPSNGFTANSSSNIDADLEELDALLAM